MMVHANANVLHWAFASIVFGIDILGSQGTSSLPKIDKVSGYLSWHLQSWHGKLFSSI